MAFAAEEDRGHSTDGAEDTRSCQAKVLCNIQYGVLTSRHPRIAVPFVLKKSAGRGRNAHYII